MSFVQGQRDSASRLLAEMAGQAVQLHVDPPEAADEPAAEPTGPRRTVSQEQKDNAMRLPLVRKLADVFDASLVDVREQSPPPGPDEKTSG